MSTQQVCRRGGKFNNAADGEKKSSVTFRVLPPCNLCDCRWSSQSFLISKSVDIYFGYIIVLERTDMMGYLVGVFSVYLAWGSRRFLDLWLNVICYLYIYLVKLLAFISSNIFFWIIVFSLFFWGSNYTYIRLFDIATEPLDALFFLFIWLVLCFIYLFLLFLLCGNFKLIYPYIHWFFPWLWLI